VRSPDRREPTRATCHQPLRTATDDRLNDIKKPSGIRLAVAPINKEHATMTTTTSRRAILAGAAVLPALAIPAMTMLPAGADPIFAAIERHRQIEAAYVAACNAIPSAKFLTPAINEMEKHAGNLCHRSSDALGDLVAMTPTTLAGCAALLRYLEAHEEAYDRTAMLDDHNQAKEAARDLLSRIAATLEAAVQS
jgi:hypothetical protein